MPEKKKKANVGAKDEKITKSGAADLTEEQLDEVSGGPHYVTFDSPSRTQKVQKVRGTFETR